MMAPRWLVLFLVISSTISIQAQSGKWKSLFNGKDLSGWVQRNGKATYHIEGDAIVGTAKLKTPNSFLCTDREYSDFIFEVEVLVEPNLNSGLQFRSISKESYRNGRVHGYQAEVDPSPRAYSGGIYDEARRGWLYPMSYNPEGMKAFKVGSWNKYRIQAIGPHLSVWINGVNTANVVDDMTASGFIALQVHSIGKEEQVGKTVKWRNIRILTEDLEEEKWEMAPHALEMNYVPNILTEHEKRKGWRLLWDGKTTKGWRSAKSKAFPDKGWIVEDGTLTVLETGGAESEAGGDIISESKFGSFELRFEFKMTKGANSGIKYFVDPELNKGPGSSIGLEYQILDDAEHPDAQLGVKGNRTLSSLYDLIPAKNLNTGGKKPTKEIGKWNQGRIIVNGNHIEHWLNGFKVVEYERNTQQFRALVAYSKYKDWPNFGELPLGNILLQDHGNRVSFRSIKIREL